MTEEEKKIARALKSETAHELSGIRDSILTKYRYALVDTDSRIGEYVCSVIDNPEGHNLYELLAVRRFFRMLDKYEWKPKRVRRFFKLYEILRFNGTHGRTRYKLTPVQCFQFANIYGLADHNGRRLIRVAYLFVPRKFSKTTSAAALAVDDMLFGDNNAQSYVGANSYEQAKICFNEIRDIMKDIDRGARHFQVNREKISFKDRGRDSFIRCLTANARTQDGLNASLVIMDEYAQARNTAGKNGADLKNTLTSSMGVRAQPLTVIITTASEVVDGPFAHALEGVKRVLRGEAEADNMFASLFMPDVDDQEDDPVTWMKVQPHLGITVQSDYYEKEWSNAQMSAENMMTFRTKLLNIFTINEAKRWFSYEKANELVCGFDIDKVNGFPFCAVAFDLSVHDDFSAVSYTLYAEDDRKFYSHTEYYFPEGALSGHPNEALYRTWHEAGYLKFCKGDCIDVHLIADDIIRRTKRVNIIAIGYDKFKAQDLVNILASAGANGVLAPFSQTIGNFNLPVEAFEMLAYSKPVKIGFNSNPITPYCFSNAVIMTDQLENKKPMKATVNQKIDGAITVLMTIGLLNSFKR